MQNGLQRVLPSAALLPALLPGLFVSQTRSKVYTSNVMDETRTQRITDHFQYMKARKQYSRALHDLFNKWRAELRAKELDIAASERQRRAQELREEAVRLQQVLRERKAEELNEVIRRTELEYKRALLQVQRSRRREDGLAQREKLRAERYQQLLEASRHWIRHEELEAAIEHAIDNPQPFGFIANLPVGKDF